MPRKPVLEARPANWRDPFGSFVPALLAADWHDQRTQKLARKAARWGYIKPPATSGKLVWLICGNSADSVALGVELTRAIREKRLDIRLVLTFEQEFPEHLDLLRGLPKTGCGYGPSDYARALNRAYARLDPFALILCATRARPNLSRALSRTKHALAIAAPAPAEPASFEYVYPASEQQGQSWGKQAAAPVVDFTSLLVEALVDPNFRTLVNGSSSRHLWWLHSTDNAAVNDFSARFFAQFPDDVLFVSGLRSPRLKNLISRRKILISDWDRAPIAGGTVVIVDVAKWLPAVAAAVTGTHLETAAPRVLWQAMAGGAAVSCDDHAVLPKRSLRQALAEFKSHEVLLYQWRAYRENPILARGSADGARRSFWQERRLAARVNAEFLERVFAW